MRLACCPFLSPHQSLLAPAKNDFLYCTRSGALLSAINLTACVCVSRLRFVALALVVVVGEFQMREIIKTKSTSCPPPVLVRLPSLPILLATSLSFIFNALTRPLYRFFEIFIFQFIFLVPKIALHVGLFGGGSLILTVFAAALNFTSGGRTLHNNRATHFSTAWPHTITVFYYAFSSACKQQV